MDASDNNKGAYIRESGCLGMQPKVGGKLHIKLNTGTRPIENKYCEGKVNQKDRQTNRSAWTNRLTTQYFECTHMVQLIVNTCIMSCMIGEVYREATSNGCPSVRTIPYIAMVLLWR